MTNIISLAALAPWGASLPNPTVVMTADELLLMGDDSQGYELIEGRLISMAPTGGRHSSIESTIDRILGNFVASHQLGAVLSGKPGFIISRNPDTVLAPDVAFIRRERQPAPDSSEWDEFLQVIPDLVVEVASPSQYKPEMSEKAQRWLAAGVQIVWTVWPKTKQVDVGQMGKKRATTLHAADALDGGDVLPGFSHLVADLFA